METKKGNLVQARSNYLLSCKNSDYAFEPYYNFSIMRYKLGDIEEAYKFNKKALEIFPDHYESKDLKEKIINQLLV